MKKLILIFIISAFTLNAKTMMWKIEKGNSPMYILGSIHVAKKELYPLNPIIENAFEKSKNLVVEVNIKNQSFSMQMKMMSLGMYQNKTIKDVLPEKLYKKVIAKANELGLPYFTISRMKPWLLGLTLSIMQIKKLGYDPNAGIDLHFLNKAIQKNKKILELETAEFQMNLLSSFGEEIDILNLKLMLKDWDKAKDLLNKMFEEWKKGEYNTLKKLTFLHKDKYPKMKIYYQKLLFDRNKNMAKKLDEMLKTKNQSYFVVVGAGHLIGKKGILELLKKKGYKVIQE